MNSTKSLIIDLLGEEHPLSLVKIHREIKIHKKLSCQGVHKALKEMIEDGSIIRTDRLYSLNKTWLKDNLKSYTRYYFNYYNITYNPKQIDNDSKIQVFRFSNLREVWEFFVNNILSKQDDFENEIFISVRRLHPFVPPRIIQNLKEFSNKYRIFIICRDDGFSDRWTARLYRSLGINVKTGVTISQHNTICIGSSVLQYYLYFDEGFKNRIHSFSNLFKNKDKSGFLKITTDIFYKKGEHYIILHRYPFFVEEMREQIRKNFQ